MSGPVDDLGVDELAGEVLAGLNPLAGDQLVEVVEVLDPHAAAHVRPRLARQGPRRRVGVEHAVGPAVDVEPVVHRDAHQLADRRQRQRHREVLDEVGPSFGRQLRLELVDEPSGVAGQRVRHPAALGGRERPGHELAELGVAGVVEEHHVERLVDVPSVQGVAAGLHVPHPLVVAAARQAEPGTAVDERGVVGADVLDVVVAGDRPERRDAVPLVPVHRGLVPQQVPVRPRVPLRLVPGGGVQVDRGEPLVPIRQHLGHRQPPTTTATGPPYRRHRGPAKPGRSRVRRAADGGSRAADTVRPASAVDVTGLREGFAHQLR